MENEKKIVLLTNKIEPSTYNQKGLSGDMFLIVVFQTPLLFSYDGEKYFKIPANSLIVYKPNSMQAYKCDSGTTMQNSFIYVDYSEDYFKKLGIPMNVIVVLKREEVEELVFEMDRLSYIVNTPYAESLVSKIPEYTNNIFVRLSEYIKNNNFNLEGLSLATSLLNIRGQMFNNPSVYTVRKMANEMGFTETYFGIKYKEMFGLSPNQDRKIQIVEKIKSYLLETDYSLEQIADLCSIKSTAHLISTFKSVEHTTPYQYKKSHK